MIIIDNNYKISGKDLNFTVESNNKLEDSNDERWQFAGYFATFNGLVNFLKKKEDLKEDTVLNLENIVEKIDYATSFFKEVKLNTQSNVKVLINDNWHIIITDMYSRIVKKEKIKLSRFTNIENVGKDKLVDIGYAPNMFMSLKILLNQLLLEFLSEEKECDLEEIDAIISSLIEDVKNIKIEEISMEIDKENGSEYCEELIAN